MKPLQVLPWNLHHHVNQVLRCRLFVRTATVERLLSLPGLCRQPVQQLVINTKSRTSCSHTLHHQTPRVNLIGWSTTSWQPVCGHFHIVPFKRRHFFWTMIIWKLISNILFIPDSRPVGLVAATVPCQRQTDSIRFSKRWQPSDTVSPDRPETSNYTGLLRFSCGASRVLLRSCFGPCLGSGGLLEGENMGTSGGSRQALALHHGRTSAWKLHYVPAVGLAVALSKNNFWQDDVFWQVQRGILQVRLLQEEKHEEEVLAIIMWGVFLFQYELACVHWWPGFDGRFR